VSVSDVSFVLKSGLNLSRLAVKLRFAFRDVVSKNVWECTKN